ncbi:actin nucleation-promoting factor WASL isoform X2 [Thunnus thynnus]|uniref:actin nucleation-promoting factor WASL isoform X2 n=1 Tax=Thunnus thynnus TaxID=8237 RepID=UPI00352908CD
MASSLIPGCQVMSDLLTIREKGVISTLLKPQHELIKSTVAQVLVAKENQDGGPGWSCLDCGVVCLIEDQSVHSYFLHLYCVKSHQAGFNFANEAEAEEFHLAVKAVQRKQEKMKGMIQMTNIDKKDNSTCDLAAPGVKPADAPSTTVTPTAISDLDPTMRKLLMRAQLTKEDLKDKDIAEAVDCIIKKFGGLKAVQRELRSRGPASQTLPKGARVSLSLALKKGPMPPPPIKSSTTFQQTPQGTDTQDQSPLAAWIPPPKSAPPPVPERIRKSASFKYVGSPTASGRSEQILSALREVFKQKQLLQRSSREEGNQMEPDTNKEEQR